MNELSEEDDVLAEGLRKRDGRFLLCLALRFIVVALFVVWLSLADTGTAIGVWAAERFGSLTGAAP